ncbi:hypothetical protein [Candidatus Protofrankia californiensis]|uniref:hypothetical protein n=1 Tax=Candidatus Protofrankia californiensis TaxID=1839754 RepID=UPI0010416AE6|nr:hypothetical protein [Candidatus Protofrankia californiensis]
MTDGGPGENPGDGQYAAEPWPDWDTADAASLARYVNPASFDDLGVPLAIVFNERHPDLAELAGRKVIQDAYEALATMRLRYGLDAWSGPHGDRQRIRYPARVRREKGTCLDLVLMLAGLLLRAQIRPVVALLDRGQDRHAILLADVRRPLDTSYLRQSRDFRGVVLPRPGAEDGVIKLAPGARLPGWLVPVDVVKVAIERDEEQPAPFEEAVRSGLEELGKGYGTTLLDITSSPHAENPLRKPRDAQTPAIYARLPVLEQAPSRYGSRADTWEALERSQGRIVLRGNQGMGKSLLAYERARGADAGYGWFLNASDRSSLLSELALAELEQMSRVGLVPDDLDREPYARAALQRLEASDAPWVVVLDNADRSPEEIRDLLPRTVKPGQTLIVTSTNAEWDAFFPGVEPIVIGPLEPSDMVDLPEQLQAVTRGRPLVYEALRRLVRAGVREPFVRPGEAGPGESGPALVWRLAAGVLAHDRAALDAAHAVAWAPPVLLPVDDLVAALGLDDSAPLDTLRDIGLVTTRTQNRVTTLQMHRLLRAEIQQERHVMTQGALVGLPGWASLASTDPGWHLLVRLADNDTVRSLYEAAVRPGSLAGLEPRRRGLVLHGVARVLELRSMVREASALYTEALGHFDPERDAPLVAECLYGQARWANQNSKSTPDEIEAGIALAREAERLANVDGTSEGRIRAARAMAMRGLLLRKTVGRHGVPDDPSTLAEALELLQHSLDERRRLDDPEVDRAEFNLLGTYVRLAKLTGGDDAHRWLQAAYEGYSRLRAMRLEQFGGVVISSIAVCTSGRGLALYYGALTGVDPRRKNSGHDDVPVVGVTTTTRLDLVRQASVLVADSLRERSELAPLDVDSDDCLKSIALLEKILGLRRLLVAATPGSAAASGAELTTLSSEEVEKVLHPTEQELLREVTTFGLVSSV